MSKRKLGLLCLAFPIIIYSIIICTYIMWCIYGDKIKDVFITAEKLVYYSGEPILSPGCIFLYLTTENSLFIGTVFLLLGISLIFNIEKLEHFILNNNIWSYISVIYFLLNFTVLFFDLFTTFQTYRNIIDNFHFSYISVILLLSRIVLHHILFLYYLFISRYIEPITPKSNSILKPILVIVIYYILWYLTINLIGKFCFGELEWYPYILIVPKGFFTLFSMNINMILKYVLYYIILGIISISLVGGFVLMKKYYERK